MSPSVLASYTWSLVDFYTVAVLVIVYWVTKYLLWHGFVSGKNLAPGFFGFPIFGITPCFWFGTETVFQRLEKLSKKCGPVIRVRQGHGTLVAVIGARAVKEGMLNDDLLGRPERTLGDEELDAAFVQKSITNLEGELWKKHRRFALVALRDLGFGKTPVMEQRIQEEIRTLIEIVDKEKGQPFNIHPALVESTGNNIISLVFGGRYDSNGQRKKRTLEMMNAMTRDNGELYRVTLIPFALKIMHKLRIGVVQRMLTVAKTFVDFMNEDIELHRKDLDRDSPRDYVDHYLIAQEKDGDFSNEIALGNAMAFFLAGSATVRVTVECLIHLMAKHPEIQRRVQAEIDELTGGSREVTWADSKELVYTSAVIAERYRYLTPAPAGTPRRVLKPTKLCGYDLEVNDQIMFSIDSVHHDPEVFENPQEFRPERFIDENGRLMNTEKLSTFSIGKRACPGESLAVLEVFLYFTTLLQNFTIEADGPVQLGPLRSLMSETIPQKVRFVRRT